MSWDYYSNKVLRDIGITNQTEDLSAWIGNKRREVKAYCKSSECNENEYGKRLILEPNEDDTCPYCENYLFYSK